MSDPKVKKSFFQEETPYLLMEKPGNGTMFPPSTPPASEPPRMPAIQPAAAAEQRAYWQGLRAFFHSGKGNGANGLYPALLAPFRPVQHLAHDYPYWMPDTETLDKEPERVDDFRSLHDLLTGAVAAIAPGENEARILNDNLLRLEVIVRQKLQGVDDTFKAFPVLEEALTELEQTLAVKGPEGEAFAADLQSLRKQLPRTGVLLPFSPYSGLLLLAAWLQTAHARRKRQLSERIRPLIARLKDTLAVEREKSPDARSPEHLASALGFADFFKFEELSSVLPDGGAEAMPAERKQRLEATLKTLQKAEESPSGRQCARILLDEQLIEHFAFDWQQTFAGALIQPVGNGGQCSGAMQAFDEEMAQAAGLFAAIRVAELETENNFVPETHLGFFNHFSWRDLSEVELSMCPPVLLIADTDAIVSRELNDLSVLLASNRPVRMVFYRSDPAGETETPLFRPEPGALAIAHRNPFVLQSTSLRAEYLLDGFRRGFTAFCPALFHLWQTPGKGTSVNERFLRISAAVEGREFPGFCYDSDRGPQWGSRFDIQANPHTANDWPAHTLRYLNAEGKDESLDLAFTFADFASLFKRHAGDFQIVPPAYWTDDLVLLSAYLQLPSGESHGKVPYLWMVNEENRLQRVAVAWPLVLICRERLDFWHFLQENAGVHSYHVERATDQLRREIEETTTRQLEELKDQHQKELKKVQEESTRAAMEGLATALLDLDPASELLETAPPKPVPEIEPEATAEPEIKEPAEKTPAEPATEEEEEILPLGEAWIDTPLCTSCNECKDINGKIFQYNADKQAYVADPKGGPFADIVLAAEKCPVRIIHPGAPQDPDEPGLEEWVKRAEPYN